MSRALAETRLRLDRGEDDPLAPLTDVRPRLGRAPTWVVISRGSRTLVRRLLLLGAGLGALLAAADAVVGGR